MDCKLIQIELVPYHFGTIDEQARAHVEAHLLVCSVCLRDFFALKRSIDTNEASEARPSAAAKSRLRAAVAREICHAASVRFPWSWSERAFAVTFAGAALMTAIAVVHVLQNAPGEAPHGIVNR